MKQKLATTTTHHQNETKVFGVESEILIKYKITKGTPSRKAALVLPGGEKFILYYLFKRLVYIFPYSSILFKKNIHKSWKFMVF